MRHAKNEVNTVPDVEAFEKGIKAVLRIRCTEHWRIPQYNTTEINGGECAACAVLSCEHHIHTSTCDPTAADVAFCAEGHGVSKRMDGSRCRACQRIDELTVALDATIQAHGYLTPEHSLCQACARGLDALDAANGTPNA